jgi:pyruvate,water dikinase
MTLTQIWGALIILIVCPLIGGLPLIEWIAYAAAGKKLTRLGTGNISVSAAFYHGGKLAGILAVLSEAGKGIGAVLLARTFFAPQSEWEIMALIALVVGRYWWGKGAGATNVTWGVIVHDPMAAMLIVLVGGVSFTIWREKRLGRLGVLGLMVVILSVQHPNEPQYIAATIGLAGLLAWIYAQIPDDLDLSISEVNPESAKMFRFFRGDRGILTLNQKLEPQQVGGKAANLSQLKQWGYAVPDGWVLKPGDDIASLTQFLSPSPSNPLVVRSSAVDEDSATSSAAGVYATFLNLTSSEALKAAILECLASYHTPEATEYRRERVQPDRSLAVIVQRQVRGMFSGVAFSRDPVNQLQDCVSIETLPGQGLNVVSGQLTPYQYRVYFPEEKIEGEGRIPKSIIATVAKIAREIEHLYHGIPQDIEWTYDGEKLWLLQTRPITTLQPLWTRKIAAEVIPGVIRPLTWSINQPLTCGVWGEIFTVVLGRQARELDFNQTATLHYHRAYFNATLLADIFLRMGLPPESLEFLTRGTKFSKPPLMATILNLPGLWRLLQREWNLEPDFARDYDRDFAPILDELVDIPAADLSPLELLTRIETILASLKKATYYSILAPLSLAFRQAIFRVPPEDLDNQKIPEVAALSSLQKIAAETRNLLLMEQVKCDSCAALFAHLAEVADGESVLARLKEWLGCYGYLSETATDIAVPRWQEDPHPVREMFTKFLCQEGEYQQVTNQLTKPTNWREKLVQKRLNLKGKVTEVYSQLLAHLRYSFLALEQKWLELGLLGDRGEIFFLKWEEIRHAIRNPDRELNLVELIHQRKFQWQESQQIERVPYLVYGNPPVPELIPSTSPLSPDRRLTGIGASAGIVEGRVKVLHTIAEVGKLEPGTILVVPYTDAGWSPILARAGGLIAEVGGRLSHGAIIAREYGIPAVMDVDLAMQIFQDGQIVRIDGRQGTVEILD